MISQEAIKKLASQYQTTELNVIREFFQHLFLRYFYRRKESKKVFFKGGTALRIIYQSPRFSEDLDFSSSLSGISVLENAVIATLSEIEKEGIKSSIKEATETSGGYLAIIHFTFDSQAVSIRLEISLRKKRLQGEIVTIIGDFFPAFTIAQLNESSLVEEKIQALLSRGKPRDFYDLYFLLRANLIPTDKKNFLPDALKALEKSKISFEKELKIFLPKSHWPVIRNFSASLKQEIKRHI